MPDARIDAMLDDLRTLVEVESPSGDADALGASGQAVADLLLRCTGRKAELVDGPAGPQVWWRGGGAPRVLLLGHHDTVFPLGTLAERPFAVTGGRATGPGVFDMKGGIVLAAHALAALEDTSGIEVLMTCDEEVGSHTSRQLLEERAVACGAVLVLEPSADGGALKIGRKGVSTFEVTIGGRAAHAGLEPHRGINALVEAAHQILAINTFGAPDRGTTVTPTVATAGTAENVVPDRATIRVDTRVAVMEEAARVKAAMTSLRAANPDATVAVDQVTSRPPMTEASSAKLLAVAIAAAEANGLARPVGVTVGGGSDGNFTAARGVPTLDGLGAVGGGAHSVDEWLDVTSLPARHDLLIGLLHALVD